MRRLIPDDRRPCALELHKCKVNVVTKTTKQKQDQQLMEQTEAERPTLDEAIYIHNAGLVLVAPFLKRFFQTLGMLEENTFASVDQATRAVHLLQYLIDAVLYRRPCVAKRIA